MAGYYGDDYRSPGAAPAMMGSPAAFQGGGYGGSGFPAASPGAYGDAGYGATPGQYGGGGYDPSGVGGGEYGGGFQGEYGPDGMMMRPQVMDVAGRPLDDSKAREILQLRSMVDSLGALVGDTAGRIDRARGDVAARGELVPVDGEAFGAGGSVREEDLARLEVDTASLPVSQGVLRIKTERRRGFMSMGKHWPERVAVVGPDGVLRLFESESSATPVTEIPLGASTEVRADTGSHKGANVAFTFLIVTPDNSRLLFSSDSEEERDAWMRTVQEVAALDERVREHNRRLMEAAQGGTGGAQGGFGGGEEGGYDADDGSGAAGAAEGKSDEELQRERERDFALEEFATRHVAYGPGITNGTRGEQTDFVVELQDEAGQADVEQFSPSDIKVVLESASLQLDLSLEDLGTGRGVCTYTPPQTGEYTLSVLVVGKHIRGSPFDIDVDPAPTAPSKCLVEGDGAHTARVGARNAFTVVARDQFQEQRNEGGDDWAVDIEGPATLLGVVDHGDGTYTVEYEVDLDHDDIAGGGRRRPQIELHVALKDPRFSRLTVDPSHPYRRPLKGMPLLPTIVQDSTGAALTASQLASLSPGAPGHEATPGPAQTPGQPRGALPLGPAPSGRSGAPAGASAASAAGARPPPPPAGGAGAAPGASGAMTAVLRSRIADLEDEMKALQLEASDAVEARRRADEAARAAEERAAEAESGRDEAEARAEAAESRAEAAEAAAAKAAGGDDQAQGILQQLTEQSAILERFAQELNERHTALEAREEAVKAEEAALAAGDRAAEAAAGPVTELSGNASLLERARLVAGDGATATPGTAGTASIVPGGGPASLASGPAASLGPSAMLRSTYTGTDPAPRAAPTPAPAAAAAASSSPSDPAAAVELSAEAPPELFAPDVMAVLEAHHPALRALLGHYSKGAPGLSAGQFVRMLKDFDVIETFTDSRQMRAVFAAAAAAHGADDVPDGDKVRIGFAAFCEAIGRMALVTLSTATFQPLYPTAKDKLEVVLEIWSLASPERLDEIKRSGGRKKKKRTGRSATPS